MRANLNRHIPASPIYEFSIQQRAALQLLEHALGHVAGMASTSSATQAAQAELDAEQILWQCRQLVLCAAERQPCQGGAR